MSQLSQAEGPEDDDWLRATVGAWAAENDNSTLRYAAQLALLPDATLELLAAEADHLDSPLHRLILKGTLAARLASMDRARATVTIDEVTAGIDAVIAGQPRVQAHELLVLFAGQWWHVDGELAARLWREAVLMATQTEDAHQRSFEVLLAVKALSLGAPRAILEPLLLHEPPSPPPHVLSFVVPGPSTSPLVAAGVQHRELLLGGALAAAMAAPGPARARYQAITDPATASLTAARAAQLNDACDLDQRADWCQDAVDHARSVDDHPLRCLLLAEAAEALKSVGLTTLAGRLAETTARDVIENGRAYGAVRSEPAYAHALGTCIRTLGCSSADPSFAEWIWDARVLGSGLGISLAYLPPMMSTDELHLLVQASRDAGALFGG